CFSFSLRGFPKAHHAALRIREERERTHAGHRLLLDVDLAARGDDFLPVCGEIVDRDVEQHVAGPGALAVRLDDAAVDAALASSLDDAVVHFWPVVDLPAEDPGVEVSDLRRVLGHQFPLNNGTAHLYLRSR